jgi:hypothetical protein
MTVNFVPSQRARKIFFVVWRLVMVIGPLGVSNEMPSAAAANSLAAKDFDFAVTAAAKMNAS